MLFPVVSFVGLSAPLTWPFNIAFYNAIGRDAFEDSSGFGVDDFGRYRVPSFVLVLVIYSHLIDTWRWSSRSGGR
jgi:hypothetical protein